MYADIEQKRERIWCITAYGSYKNSNRTHNQVFNIVAETAECAIERLQGDPDSDLIIESVTHKGAIGPRRI